MLASKMIRLLRAPQPIIPAGVHTVFPYQGLCPRPDRGSAQANPPSQFENAGCAVDSHLQRCIQMQ